MIERTFETSAEAEIARAELLSGTPTHRKWKPNHERIGIAGEEAFAAWIGQTYTYKLLPRADGGRDFIVRFVIRGEIEELPVDVKAAEKPMNLTVTYGKLRKRTIYVLAGYSARLDRCRLLGWEFTSAFLSRPLITLPPTREVQNHAVHITELRDMDELKMRLAE